MIVVLSLMWRD